VVQYSGYTDPPKCNQAVYLIIQLSKSRQEGFDVLNLKSGRVVPAMLILLSGQSHWRAPGMAMLISVAGRTPIIQMDKVQLDEQCGNARHCSE
jgi:hypothetical protein